MPNWKEIHPDFTPELQKEWEDRGFSYRSTKERINIGSLKPNDYDYAWWLKIEKGTYPTNNNSKGKWKTEYKNSEHKKWIDIHKDFWHRSYQKKWREEENLGFDFKTIKPWIDIGFKPEDYNAVEKWKEYKFDSKKTKQWIKVGLRVQDYELAAYAEWKGYQPKKVNIKEIKVEYHNVQNWLNFHYRDEKKRNEVERLTINEKRLTEKLDINFQNFPNVREIACFRNELTYLNLNNCINLTALICSENNIIQDLTFLDSNEFINLRRLDISNNHFFGSLRPLSRCKKLQYLNISNTDLNSGIEHLPKNLRERTNLHYRCERLSSKVKEIEKQLDFFISEKWVEWSKLGLIWEETYFWAELLKTSKHHDKIEGWKKFGFTWEEAKSWIEVGLKSYEYDFANYLKNEKELGATNTNINLKKLRREYYDISGDKLSEKVIKQIKNFDHCNLSSDQKSLIEELMFNKELKRRYQKYGLCDKCEQLNGGNLKYISGYWCEFCDSNKKEVDDFIHNYQSEEESNVKKRLEWIPYKQFKNIEYLADGGFSKVCKAKWDKESARYWDVKEGKWKRWDKKEIILKNLNNSCDITVDFLQEVAKHKLFDNRRSSLITKCLGISQDPKTKNYIMVMEYMKGGNLRQYLQNSHRKLEFMDKFSQLCDTANGLNSIHELELTHRDFHSGNILISKHFRSYIADLGLCCPVDSGNERKGIYGVLPYVAPEVLRSQPYTKAADIYSFGIIAYEVLSDLPPYQNLPHDEWLTVQICKGLRPQFNIKIPQMLEDLIKRCWNAEIQQRPAVSELSNALNDWYKEVYSKENTKFTQQVQETEKFNKSLIYEKKLSTCNLHPSAIYTSRCLNNFTKNLPKVQNSKEINQIFYKLTEELEDLRIVDPVKFSSELKKKFNNLQIQEKSQEILIAESEEIPPIEIPQQSLNWTALRPNFTPELIFQWTNHHFSPSQTNDWLNIGLQPTDHSFAAFLRDQKQLTPEEVLNHGDIHSLNQEFSTWQAQPAQVEIPPK